MALSGSSTFDVLLATLDVDRNVAASKYEDLRQRLMRVFRVWGSDDPGRDADITLERVAAKLSGGEQIRSENPYVYFHGVARFVFKEQLRARTKDRTAAAEAVRAEARPEADDPRRADCLDRCLDGLAADARNDLLDYYDLQQRARIDRRRQMADRLGISVPALRLRMHRERDRLRACVLKCGRSENTISDT